MDDERDVAGIQFWPDVTPVDPNMVALDWNVLAEQLVLVVVVATIIERALSTVFETDWFVQYQRRRKAAGRDTGGVKTMLGLLVSFIGALLYQLDIMAVLLSHHRTSLIGSAITAAVIAGGSKGSLKLFRDVLNIKSTAREQYEADKRVPPPQTPSSDTTTSAG